MILARQVMLGGCVSLIVILKVQLGPAGKVQVTVVVPLGKNEPEAGEQVAVPHEPEGAGVG
ncbi:MAG: hypothetical protein DLM73_10770 [Chthoniobacterales bacterium]|nr:MAG: hypothetical protein DLM73_10770 [Chthoniobacterales bacterium]